MSAINPWTGPQWKAAAKTQKKARAKRTRKLKRSERAEKADVRKRDQHCRFPRCGCRRSSSMMKAWPTVSHLDHKGMGGNPKGDRSTAAGMMLLCKWRHQDAKISRDKGSLRYVPLTDAGCNGPVRWDIDASIFWPAQERIAGERSWRALFIETAINEGHAVDDWAEEVLDELAGMEL